MTSILPTRTCYWLTAVWLIAGHAGCLHEASQSCSNGSVCPAGMQCVDPGTTADRICVAGTCGNGRLDPGEACDDGNNHSGDGCPADCTTPCGDGVLDPGEVCDDGNTTDGDGCSADCRSLDELSLISPPSVVFQASEGDPPPAAIIVTVRPPVRGDLVLIGDVPGVARPAWLSVASGPSTADSFAFELRVTDTGAAGDRAASQRLTIHHRITGVDTFDLPISYHVAASDLAVQAMPASLTFTAFEGNPAIDGQPVAVTFNGDDVALVSAPAWLTVTGPPAPASPASFVISIDDPSPVAFTVLSGDAVFATTRGTVRRTTALHVDYQVLPPPELAISAAPRELTFSAVTGAAIPPPQTVDLMFTGASVDVLSAPSWLTVTAPAAPGSPASFTVAVNTTAFAGGSLQQGNILFATNRDDAQETTTVHIAYTLRYPPELLFVAPYVGIAGRAGTLLVRGRGLQTGQPITLQIGDTSFGPLTPDSDSLVTLSYPALPAGRYPVVLVDPPVTSPRAPELVIVAPPAFAYQAVAAPGNRQRILYDAERQMLYSASAIDERIDRFAYAGGSWTLQPTIPFPALSDVAMAPDGRSLIVVDESRINEMSLGDGQYVAVERAHQPETTGCSEFSIAAPGNNGKVLVLSVINGSGFCPAYFYDMLDHSLRALPRTDLFYFGGAHASGDGSRIFAGDTDGPLRLYDMLLGTSASVALDSGVYAVSVNTDASRIIVDGARVYSRTFRLTGNVPVSDVLSTLVSRDGSRAFIYPNDWQHPRIEVYDLNGPLQPGAMYPLLKTIPLPDGANGPNEYAMAMTSTPDDAVVFVSGASKLLVVPVN